MRLHRHSIRSISVFMTFLTLLPAFLSISYADEPAVTETDTPARSLGSECLYTFSGKMKNPRCLYDNSLRTGIDLTPEDALTIKIPESVPVSVLFLSFSDVPPAYSVTMDGPAVHQVTEPSSELLMPQIPVPDGTDTVTVHATAGCRLLECDLYSSGSDPAAYHTFEETPEKLDYLVVSAHPDDEQLYLGAVAPVYSDRGLTGTVLYMTCNRRERYSESLNACHTAGIRKMPLFLWLRDGTVSRDKIWKYWDKDSVVTELVRILRRTRPEVVVTHQFGGEYGQGLHIATAEAVSEAVKLAPDRSFDAESVQQYGSWQVKKLYVHVHNENVLHLPVNNLLPSFGGLTALEVARKAFREHASEFKKLHLEVHAKGPYDMSSYGLYFSAVGPDSGKNDMFENIQPDALTNFDPSSAAVPSGDA